MDSILEKYITTISSRPNLLLPVAKTNQPIRVRYFLNHGLLRRNTTPLSACDVRPAGTGYNDPNADFLAGSPDLSTHPRVRHARINGKYTTPTQCRMSFLALDYRKHILPMSYLCASDNPKRGRTYLGHFVSVILYFTTGKVMVVVELTKTVMVPYTPGSRRDPSVMLVTLPGPNFWAVAFGLLKPVSALSFPGYEFDRQSQLIFIYIYRYYRIIKY